MHRCCWCLFSSDVHRRSPQHRRTPRHRLRQSTESPELENVAEGVTGAVTFKVIKIVDGDTIDVLTDDKKTIRLRFNGIDTPERGQPFGNNATKFVSDTVGGKIVRLSRTTRTNTDV